MFDIVKKYNFWDGIVKGIGVERRDYIEKIKKLDAGKTIITVTGGRRVGKSFIVRQYIHELINSKKVPPENILYVNYFMHEFEALKEPAELHEIIQEWERFFQISGQRKYVIIDEVQELQGWEKVVCSLYENYTEEYKVIITGSNSKLLSGELHTYTAGRSHQLTIYPLSYKEFLTFTGKNKNKESFIEFLRDGGLPEIVLNTEEYAKSNLISSILDTVIMRDIIERHDIRNYTLLKKLVNFFCESYSDEVSINKITSILASAGMKASNHTIADYVEYIKQAFFIYECETYSYKKNDILRNSSNKFYLNDIKFAINYGGMKNIGKMLENAVYIELKRRNHNVYTLALNNAEVDFLIESKGEREYYQVTYTIGDPGTKLYQREFGNLLMINDQYPKYVLSLDDISFASEKGVKHENIMDFMMADH